MRRAVNRRNLLITAIVAATMPVAGCTQRGGGTATGTTTQPESTDTDPTSSPESSTTTETETETSMDHPDEIADRPYATTEVRETQVLTGGLTPGSERRHHVALFESSAELDRLERERLDEATSEFLAETDFDTENLLVIQVTLPSSAMAFTVEKVGVRDGTVHVRVTYSNSAGTQNEIVETELVRFADSDDVSAGEVVVHAEDFPYAGSDETTFTASD